MPRDLGPAFGELFFGGEARSAQLGAGNLVRCSLSLLPRSRASYPPLKRESMA